MSRVRNGGSETGPPRNQTLRQLQLFDTPEAYTTWLESHLRELNAGQKQAKQEAKANDGRGRHRHPRQSKAEAAKRQSESNSESEPPEINQRWHIGDAAFYEDREVRVMLVRPIKGLAKIRPRNSHRVGAQRWVNLRDLKPAPSRAVDAKTWADVSEATGDLLKDWEPRKKPCPTLSLPGTAERIAVYRRRVERGEQIFCDLDASSSFNAEVPDNWETEDPSDEQLRREARNSRNIHLPTFDYRGSNKSRRTKQTESILPKSGTT